jgi:glycosyltransferase involved in cell wall biosynthesis
VKYAKYLPRFGWEPHVLTVNVGGPGGEEIQPLDFECSVTRTGVLPRPDDVYKKLRGLLPTIRSERGVQVSSTGASPRPTPGRPPQWKRFVNSLSWTPDAQIGWYLPAFRAAKRLLRQKGFDAVYSSGPPNTCHLVGLAVAKHSGLPWVVDFRDPWYLEGAPERNLLHWSHEFNRRKEAETIERAALVVTTTPEWRDALVERYGASVEHKCATVLNGFDEAQFPPLDAVPVSRPNGRPLTFFHGGSLYKGRNPRTLIRAVGELIRDGRIHPEALRMRFFGKADIDVNEIRKTMDDLGMSEVASFSGPISATDYTSAILESDVLVLLQSEGASVNIPAKAFEYLATGNRIFVLTGKGSTRNFMKDFDHVWLAGIEDSDGIKAAVLELLGSPHSTGLSIKDRERIRRLTKERLAGEFAELLSDTLVERR